MSLPMAFRSVLPLRRILNRVNTKRVCPISKIAKLLMLFGAGNIVLVDRQGAVSVDEDWLNPAQRQMAEVTNRHNERGPLAEIIRGKDVFIGVSAPKVVTAEMVATMAPDAIVFAMANPTPEIMPEEAAKGGARVIATGRSDYPNQINNVLVFPGIFKGALAVRATDITEGMKERAAELTKKLLNGRAPLDIVNAEIIPALNIVGEGFEEKKVYLPQLLMSAEAAKAAFEVIKFHMAGSANAAKRGPIVIATVHGDIHDIGKNIVKLLLENYGFDVIDLGKDVPPRAVVDAVVSHHAPLAGLSALMTTTVPAMEETIRLLRQAAPYCKIIVGGAVLTRDYADRIGADMYAKDAMEAVRYAEEIID